MPCTGMYVYLDTVWLATTPTENSVIHKLMVVREGGEGGGRGEGEGGTDSRWWQKQATDKHASM